MSTHALLEVARLANNQEQTFLWVVEKLKKIKKNKYSLIKNIIIPLQA